MCEFQVSKATSSIMRLFTSRDVHYNNSPNTEEQKQSETYIKKLQTKVVDSMIFRIHCNTFFQKNLRGGELVGERGLNK